MSTIVKALYPIGTGSKDKIYINKNSSDKIKFKTKSKIVHTLRNNIFKDRNKYNKPGNKINVNRNKSAPSL